MSGIDGSGATRAAHPPTLTRVHAAALFAGRGVDVVVVHSDGRVELTTAESFAAGETGHLALCRSELVDAGVRWRAGTALFAPSSGPGVEAVLAAANSELAALWRDDPELDSRSPA